VQADAGGFGIAIFIAQETSVDHRGTTMTMNNTIVSNRNHQDARGRRR
jgi:hypothetical protein